MSFIAPSAPLSSVGERTGCEGSGAVPSSDALSSLRLLGDGSLVGLRYTCSIESARAGTSPIIDGTRSWTSRRSREVSHAQARSLFCAVGAKHAPRRLAALPVFLVRGANGMGATSHLKLASFRYHGKNQSPAFCMKTRPLIRRYAAWGRPWLCWASQSRGGAALSRLGTLKYWSTASTISGVLTVIVW